MKLGLITRKSEAKWGGDLAALYSIYNGLKQLGRDVLIGGSAAEVSEADFIFLHNTSYDLKPDFAILNQLGKRFGVIALHADRSLYYSTCYAFAHFVGLCLRQFHSIEQLIDNPGILDLFPYTPPSLMEENRPILQEAEICIATSATEAATIKRDVPGCHTAVVHLESGIAQVPERSEIFLQWTGLARGEYILQVGRIELRKNQLATLLAMRDSPIPLVFIATETFYPEYEQMCLEAIRKFRRGPTLIISQTLSAVRETNLRILPMPEGRKLSQEMLFSAYQNAGLHVHPAFCELPGLVYLESAKLNVPAVASEWTTIADYFADPSAGGRLSYVLPYDIQNLQSAIRQNFGKEVDPNFSDPIFNRTSADVASDILKYLQPIDNLF